MLDDLVCPVSNVRIDRNVVRTNGLITTLLLVTYVVLPTAWIAVPVGLDYVLRAQMHAPASPMTRVAQGVARVLRLPPRPMDKASKVFASRIGVCFAMGVALCHVAAPAVARWLAGTLAVFTALESVFDLCVGCVVYTHVALPLYRAREAVRAIPLFQRLEDPMLVAVANGFRFEALPADTRLVTAGEPGDRLFVLRAGEVEVFREEGGGRQVIATQGPGSFFGELALLSAGPRTASVRSLTPISVLVLRRDDFEALTSRHPGMRAMVERAAAERIQRDASLGHGTFGTLAAP